MSKKDLYGDGTVFVLDEWHDESDDRFGAEHSCSGGRVNVTLSEGCMFQVNKFTKKGKPPKVAFLDEDCILDVAYGRILTFIPKPINPDYIIASDIQKIKSAGDKGASPFFIDGIAELKAPDYVDPEKPDGSDTITHTGSKRNDWVDKMLCLIADALKIDYPQPPK